MKMNKKMFIFARARNIGQTLAEQEFARISKTIHESKKDRVKIYLDEYGNEVHVKGPIVDRIHKSESLAERIARYDRLAAAVNASRQSMALAFGDMFTDDDEDPTDDSLLDATEVINEFGEAVKPSVAEPEKSAGAPAQPSMPAAGVSPAPAEAAAPAAAPAGVPAGTEVPSGMPSN